MWGPGGRLAAGSSGGRQARSPARLSRTAGTAGASGRNRARGSPVGSPGVDPIPGGLRPPNSYSLVRANSRPESGQKSLVDCLAGRSWTTRVRRVYRAMGRYGDGPLTQLRHRSTPPASFVQVLLAAQAFPAPVINLTCDHDENSHGVICPKAELGDLGHADAVIKKLLRAAYRCCLLSGSRASGRD